MDTQFDNSAAINELINIKSKIEQESSELIEERARLMEKLKLIKSEKESQRSSNAELYLKLIQARLENLSAKRRVQNMACHVEWQKQQNQVCDKDITDQLNMPIFAESIEQLRSSIESAINFYSEDCLQMELMKRNNNNREMRVELTRVTNEIEQKKKELETELEEKKRIEQAKLEREKQEEERKRMIAEEKARRAAAARYQSPAPTPDMIPMTSFRSVTFAARSPELPFKQNFSGNGLLSPQTNGHKIFESDAKERSSDSFIPTFSQITRGW